MLHNDGQQFYLLAVRHVDDDASVNLFPQVFFRRNEDVMVVSLTTMEAVAGCEALLLKQKL